MPDSETNANDLLGVFNTPLQKEKKDEKKYLPQSKNQFRRSPLRKVYFYKIIPYAHRRCVALYRITCNQLHPPRRGGALCDTL